MSLMLKFRKFWWQYLRKHRNPTCRRLHFIGTTIALVVGFSTAFPEFVYWVIEPSTRGFLRFFLLLAGSLLLGYLPAWIGHFRYEHNTPATFGHPFLSFACDLWMWWLMLRRKM